MEESKESKESKENILFEYEYDGHFCEDIDNIKGNDLYPAINKRLKEVNYTPLDHEVLNKLCESFIKYYEGKYSPWPTILKVQGESLNLAKSTYISLKKSNHDSDSIEINIHEIERHLNKDGKTVDKEITESQTFEINLRKYLKQQESEETKCQRQFEEKLEKYLEPIKKNPNYKSIKDLVLDIYKKTNLTVWEKPYATENDFYKTGNLVYYVGGEGCTHRFTPDCLDILGKINFKNKNFHTLFKTFFAKFKVTSEGITLEQRIREFSDETNKPLLEIKNDTEDQKIWDAIAPYIEDQIKGDMGYQILNHQEYKKRLPEKLKAKLSENQNSIYVKQQQNTNNLSLNTTENQVQGTQESLHIILDDINKEIEKEKTGQEEEQKRKQQETEKKRQEEAEKKRQEDLKKQKQEAEKKRQENLRKQKLEEAEKKRQEDLKKQKLEEAEKERQENLRKQQQKLEDEKLSKGMKKANPEPFNKETFFNYLIIGDKYTNPKNKKPQNPKEEEKKHPGLCFNRDCQACKGDKYVKLKYELQKFLKEQENQTYMNNQHLLNKNKQQFNNKKHTELLNKREEQKLKQKGG